MNSDTTAPRKYPLFLMGMERSGVTLLHSMLKCHPNICLLSSSFAINLAAKWRSGVNTPAQLNTFLDDAYTITRFRHAGVPRSSLENELLDHLPLEFADAYYRILCSYCAHTNKQEFLIWGERAFFQQQRTLDLAHELFKDFRILHLVRDGRAVLTSVLKAHEIRNGGFDNNIIRLAGRWKRAIAVDTSLSQDRRYFRLRYEDMITQPVLWLSRVCQFLGVDYDDEMLRYSDLGHVTPIHGLLTEKPNPNRINAWQSESPFPYLRIFDLLTRSELRRLDYAPLPEHIIKSKASVLMELAAYRLRHSRLIFNRYSRRALSLSERKV